MLHRTVNDQNDDHANLTDFRTRERQRERERERERDEDKFLCRESEFVAV